MRKLELIRENETYNIFQDFAIQTDHQIRSRRPDLMLRTYIYIYIYREREREIEGERKIEIDRWIERKREREID